MCMCSLQRKLSYVPCGASGYCLSRIGRHRSSLCLLADLVFDAAVPTRRYSIAIATVCCTWLSLLAMQGSASVLRVQIACSRAETLVVASVRCVPGHALRSPISSLTVFSPDPGPLATVCFAADLRWRQLAWKGIWGLGVRVRVACLVN